MKIHMLSFYLLVNVYSESVQFYIIKVNYTNSESNLDGMDAYFVRCQLILSDIFKFNTVNINAYKSSFTNICEFHYLN